MGGKSQENVTVDCKDAIALKTPALASIKSARIENRPFFYLPLALSFQRL
jgi:hypothetical protein